MLEHTSTPQRQNSFLEKERSVSIAIGTLIVLEDIASASMDLWGTVWIAGLKPSGTRTGRVWSPRARTEEHANQGYRNASVGWDTLATTVNLTARHQSI